MNLEKFGEHVGKLEGYAKSIKEAGAKPAATFEKDANLRSSASQAMKNFAGMLKQVLMDLLKDRKEQIRPGQIYRDAATKSLVPTDIPGDQLLIKWGGHVTPTAPAEVHEACAKFEAAAVKLIPVLKAYQKEK